MADPVNYEDWANYPPDDAPEVKQSLIRSFFAKVIARTKAMPETWIGKAGEVLLVNAAETGPMPVSTALNTTTLFGNLPVKNYKAAQVSVTGSISITDTAHGGGLLVLTNGSSATLTVTPNATPSVGVSDGFACEILRTTAASAVVIAVSGGLTLRNPDSHTKVSTGGIARLQLVGTDLYLLGFTEA